MNDDQGDIPGYFVGRPMNYAEPKEKEPQAVDEQKAVNTQTPGDYFVGRPANLESSDHNSRSLIGATNRASWPNAVHASPAVELPTRPTTSSALLLRLIHWKI